jgi:hypothetical protein
MFFSGNNDGGRMMLNQTFTIGIYMWNLPYEASLIRMHVIWKCPNGLKFSNQSKSGKLQLQGMENLMKFGGMKTFSISVDNFFSGEVFDNL